MTNNDELALKLRKIISHGAPGVWLSPIEVEALLAERDADKKRIEMLEKYVDERDAQNQELLLNIGSLQQRIAEMEARTVSVKFDPIPMEELGNKNQGKQHPYMFGAGYNTAVVSCKCALENACAAAGIKLEVGE